MNARGSFLALLPWWDGEDNQRLRQIVQRLEATITKVASDGSGGRPASDFRIAQLLRENIPILEVIQKHQAIGGRARAATAFRDGHRKYLSKAEAWRLVEGVALAEYERHATGGRARERQASRTPDGRFLPKACCRPDGDVPDQ